jgi:cytochrome c biogenesis protein CcdA
MMADVLAGISRLVQGELALARAEAAERLNSARQAVIQVAIAVVLGITAINVLATAAIAGSVALGLDPVWASTLIGGILLLLALGFSQHAFRLLREAGAPPRRSGDSIKRDVETLQTMVKRDATA